MHEIAKQLLQKYNNQSEQDYLNALKEIFQEIALLALWRAKFYERAAFYGGSALRILYGLDRFSEDLDFTLLKPDKNFNLASYNQAITDEMRGFGFDVKVETKNKNILSNIESAFIKADSKKQLLSIEAPIDITARIHNMHTIKIKMEVDINPPPQFNTEVKTLLQPIPFFVKTLTQPDLFAGKIHALLCRPWQKRVKGRDWYDFVWYVARDTPINLIHLQQRLIQSNAWEADKSFTKQDLIILLKEKINNTDFNNAKNDVIPFLKDPQSITLWSKDFFLDLINRIQTLSVNKKTGLYKIDN
jgi:predicted nucleotidyltransferase component of viral defense system